MKFIQDQVASNKLGEVKLIRSSFGFPPFKQKDNIRYQKTLGGGSLLDAGAYTLKISQILMGHDIYIGSAELDTPDDSEVDICGSALILSHDNNLTAQVAFGFDNFYQNSLEIWGSNGILKATRLFTAGPGVQAKVSIETTKTKNIDYFFEDNHFQNMLNYFFDTITGSKDPEVEYNSNINQARLIEEINAKSK